MTETPAEANFADERLMEALVAFTGCVGEALTDICSYGLTIGETYVPFDPDETDDCDEDEAICSQAWVRVAGVTPALGVDGFDGECGAVLRIDLEVGIVRCIEVPEGGEAPTATGVMLAALKAMSDMRTIYCAATSCEVWDRLDVGAWTPNGPSGGQHGGIWTFSVEL